MANYKAIAAIADAIILLLQSNAPEGFETTLEFKVFTARNFSTAANVAPIAAGVSLFPYRLYVNGVNRSPGGGPNHPLPVELHFLLTIWGEDCFVQNSLAGWVMRLLEDNPTLPASVLNSGQAGAVFAADETIQIVAGDLSTEDLFRIWERFAPQPYCLSIPYLARIAYIEPLHLQKDGHPVQERQGGADRKEAFDNG